MDCTRLGFIIDANICLDDARIVSVIAELPSKAICIKRNTVEIPWECIKKIGDDLIIADYILPPTLEKHVQKSSILSRLFKN